MEAIETKSKNGSEKNICAQFKIISSLGKSVLELLELSEDALELWKSISEQFENTPSGMVIEILKKLSGTRLNDHEKTEEHLAKLRSYFNEINAVQKIFSSKAFINMIFQSLDVNFKTPQIVKFTPMSEKSIIRVFLTMAAHKKHKVYHLDIESAFLNGELEEEV